MLPGEPNSARLTADMLPAIEAVVFRKVILTASGWTLFLGAMGLLSSVEHMDESAGVLGYVALLTGLLLIGMGEPDDRFHPPPWSKTPRPESRSHAPSPSAANWLPTPTHRRDSH